MPPAAAGTLGVLGALLWRGAAGSAIVVRGGLLLFPLVYYVTHVFERYRFPLEPLVVLAAASLVVRIPWIWGRMRGPGNS